MNPYLLCFRSLDNCRIYHNEPLVELVRAVGYLILYSPDLNSIKEVS